MRQLSSSNSVRPLCADAESPTCSSLSLVRFLRQYLRPLQTHICFRSKGTQSPPSDLVFLFRAVSSSASVLLHPCSDFSDFETFFFFLIHFSEIPSPFLPVFSLSLSSFESNERNCKQSTPACSVVFLKRPPSHSFAPSVFRARQ